MIPFPETESWWGASGVHHLGRGDKPLCSSLSSGLDLAWMLTISLVKNFDKGGVYHFIYGLAVLGLHGAAQVFL